MTYEYTELPVDVQRAAISTRIRELEEQHLSISVRAEAVGLGETGDADTDALERLEQSIETLKARRDALKDD